MQGIDDAGGGPARRHDWTLTALARTAVFVIRYLSANKIWHFTRLNDFLRLRVPSVVARTYFGSKIRCDLSDFIGKRIFFFGVWEPTISQAIASELRAGDCFIDIGANIGYDTLLASAAVGPLGRVVAIEAARTTYELLLENLTLNDASNVRAVNLAVSDREGELILYSEAGNRGRTSATARTGSSASERVRSIPLDHILTDEERACVRLIKIDIEGGEIAVIDRLLVTLARYPQQLSLLVELSKSDDDRAEQLFQTLISRGFSAFQLENDYSIEAYMRGHQRAPPPHAITSLPDMHCDVLFRRGNHAQ